MSKRFSERILEYLRQPEYQPVAAQRLAKSMGIAEAEYGDFHDTVDALHRVGRVMFGSDNAVMLPHPPNQVTGTFRGNPRGFGFVVPDGPSAHGDLFIPPESTLDAITGDTVLCTVVPRGMKEGKRLLGGRIIKIVKRGDSLFVGQLRCEGNLWFVQPDGNTLHVPILVADVGAKGAKPGDQVVVEITRYPSEGKPAKGVITERLGKQGAPGVDLASIIRQYHLPTEFSPETLAEVRAAAKAFDPESAASQREDLSKTLTITIDPDDAKDYDDAISLERLDKGSVKHAKHGGKDDSRAVWELGVHIADVSAFVREGGAIDADASERCTSVYFPGYVVPMLPEVLSNGLCSLQEAEPRLCKSAFMRLDDEGEVLATRFSNTVIRSAKRLTYRQATAILDGDRSIAAPPVVKLIERMNQLAKIIQARRIRKGMITLELPEVELILDDEGRVTDARPQDTSFSHTIIEMFMVEANEAVARQLDRLGVPFIRRIHPEPNEEALEAMGRFMRAAGYNVPKKITPADLQELLRPLAGTPEAYAVNLAVLKSMQMAEYSPKCVGHFALASKHYTHFTSPIRRYADLMIHRLLDRHLQGKLGPKGRGHEEVPDDKALIEWGQRLSTASRRAESAERELKTLKVLQLLSEHVGDEFEGVVTGVTNFGLFVQHPKYLIDGLLRIEDLGDDWWAVDVQSGRVVGERTRQVFTMGSLLAVKIAEIDLSARQMKLVLTRQKGRTGRSRSVPPPGRKPGGDTRREKPGGRRGRMEGRRAKSFRKRRGRS